VINSECLACYSGGLTAAPSNSNWNFDSRMQLVLYQGKTPELGGNIERLRGNTFRRGLPRRPKTYIRVMPGNDTGLSIPDHRLPINADVPATVTFRGSASPFSGLLQDDNISPNLSLTGPTVRKWLAIITEQAATFRTFAMKYRHADPFFWAAPYIYEPTQRHFEPRIGFCLGSVQDGKTSFLVASDCLMFYPCRYKLVWIDGSVPFDMPYMQPVLPGPYAPKYQPVPTPPSGRLLPGSSKPSTATTFLQFAPLSLLRMQWAQQCFRFSSHGHFVDGSVMWAAGRHMSFKRMTSIWFIPR